MDKSAPARVVIALFGALARAVPRPAALVLGRGLGLLGYLLVSSRRRVAVENIRQAYPGLSSREARRLARASFSHLGMNAAEFLLLPVLTAEQAGRLVGFEGEEHLKAALAGGRGVLALTAHLGNWDLLSAALVLRGFPVALVSKVSRSGAVNEVWMGYREKAGVRVFAGKNMMRGILSHLRQGGIVGFVLDQNALPEDGVFVPFFGRPACTLSSLAVLAARTGAPVVPIHTFREGKGHKVVIGPPLAQPEAPGGEAGVLERTRAYMRWTEEVIRRHPGQWTWLHKRWKTQPPVARASIGGADRRRSTAGAGGRPAVFLDRDGTLIDETGYLGDPEQIPGKLLPGAREAVILLGDAGFLTVVVTNQSGVGRGLYSAEAAQAVNLRLLQELSEGGGGRLDALYFCPHLPDAGCDCRKPGEGMVRRAAFDLSIDLSRSWVIGDMDKDVLLAKAAGMNAALVRTGHREKGSVPPGTREFDDVLAAARFIVTEKRG